MREIKFRVRRKDGTLIGFIRFEDGRWQCQQLESAGGSGEWSSGVLYGAVVEQYTGLEDKNGVDIYEGDVVRRGEGTAAQQRETHEVRFRVNHGLLNDQQSGINAYFGPVFVNLGSSEVIGNIYENGDHPSEGK